MRIGFHLTPFWSPTDRNPTQIIDEAIEVVRAASTMGFAWVSIGHHWISHPTIWNGLWSSRKSRSPSVKVWDAF